MRARTTEIPTLPTWRPTVAIVVQRTPLAADVRSPSGALLAPAAASPAPEPVELMGRRVWPDVAVARSARPRAHAGAGVPRSEARVGRQRAPGAPGRLSRLPSPNAAGAALSTDRRHHRGRPTA